MSAAQGLITAWSGRHQDPSWQITQPVYPEEVPNHSSMPEDFLTIKQAATHTGKAEITIRRFVQRIVKGTDARLRAQIKPSPDELAQHTDGPPPAWRISTKLLRDQFPPDREENSSVAESSQRSADGSLVATLKLQNATLEKQLDVKDEQIKALTTLVHSMGNQLNERLRESNVLMKGLQERLTLPERSATATSPNSESKATVISIPQGSEHRRSKSDGPTTSARPKKSPRNPKPEPKRMSLFRRLFRA